MARAPSRIRAKQASETRPDDTEDAALAGHDALIASMAEFKDMDNFLSKETDRAAAVLAPAFLEAKVRDLLAAFLVPSPSTKLILSPRRGARGRIDLCEALGLLGESVVHDLGVMAEIRNLFAHVVACHSFDYPAVQKLISKFRNKHYGSNKPEGAREAFEMVAFFLNFRISIATAEETRERRLRGGSPTASLAAPPASGLAGA